MLIAPFALAKVHREAPNPYAHDQPPPPPRPVDASAERPVHTHMHQGLVVAKCPTSLTGLDEICEQQCETDDDCDSEEICCTVGCSSACALGVLPPRMPFMAVAIVAMLTGAWLLVCMMLNGNKQGGSSD